MLVLGLLLYKQRPAYDMRMSDWSSDVCSSDRVRRAGQRQVGVAEPGRPHRRRLVEIRCFLVRRQVDDVADARPTQTPDVGGHTPARRRAAEPRVGKECGSTVRSRWATYYAKQKSTPIIFTRNAYHMYST